MLFVLVNLARFVKVDPEQALRRTNAKFRKRFGYIEARLAERGTKPEDANIEEMEALWQEAKRSRADRDPPVVPARRVRRRASTAEDASGDSPMSNCCPCGSWWW